MAPVADPLLGITALHMGATSGMLDTHQQIFDLSAHRISLETNLIKLQRETIMLDMKRIQALQTMTSNVGPGGSVLSLEGAFSKLYELRGRMGLGGFTREGL